jgi:hypothetical protein
MASLLGSVVAASVGGCGGESMSSPTAVPTVNVTHSPAAGATVTNGASYEVRVEESGRTGLFFTTVAFVRDDGTYSGPFMCGETSGGGSGFMTQRLTHDVRDAGDMLNFAVGRRVNLVVLVSSRSICPVVGFGAQAVDPSQADIGRTDASLNWLVGG